MRSMPGLRQRQRGGQTHFNTNGIYRWGITSIDVDVAAGVSTSVGVGKLAGIEVGVSVTVGVGVGVPVGITVGVRVSVVVWVGQTMNVSSLKRNRPQSEAGWLV